MFNKEFYPTPTAVIRKMLEPWLTYRRDEADHKTLGELHILEPSAGSGAFLKFIVDSNRRPHCMHAIEIEPDLQSVLRGAGFAVVHDDFLSFVPTVMYDLIVMNPPFSNGDEHLLKAWEILHHGDIACLLPTEMLRNPYTQRRQLVKDLIAQHGSTEDLGPVFKNAERKTAVEVTLVRLKKADTGKHFDFFGNTHFDRAEKVFEFEGMDMGTRTPAVNDIVASLVAQYGACRELMLDYLRARHRLVRMMDPLMARSSSDQRKDDPIAEALKEKDAKSQHNRFSLEMQDRAWQMVMNKTKVHDLMTASVRNNFDKFRQQQGQVAFTEANIHRLFDMLYLNRGEILHQGIVDAFDLMTRYHEENRVHVEGWKSNDMFRVSKKVVLPNVVSFSYSNVVDYRRAEELNDIDRGLAMLEGRKLSQVRTIAATIEAHRKAYRARETEETFCLSEYFKIRYYYKGTVHLTFLDTDLWDAFNIAAAKGKKWLPMDYKQPKPKKSKAEQPAAEVGLMVI